MKNIHSWGGRYFGYIDGDDLWSGNGNHVGKIVNNEIYGSDGGYLGEIKHDKLITNISKKSKRKSGFIPFCSRVGVVSLVNHVGNVMYVGYEDFPKLN